MTLPPGRALLAALRNAARAVALLCLAALALGPLAGFAQPADVQRNAALATWLNGDEAAGLRALADLARSGDAQAQVVLGLIDRNAALQGPAILSLSRNERIALLRAPGGLSGRNWLAEAAAQGNELAQAWQALAAVDAGPGIAERFAAMGEDRAVAQALLTLSKRQDRGFDAALLAQDWYPDSLVFLARDLTQAGARADSLHPGDPQRRYLTGDMPAPEATQDWLASAPAALHLRAACAVECPATQSACQLALYHALGSYGALLTHGSPMNGVVPDSVLAESPRGRAALARRIMLMRATRLREAQREKLSEIDSCAADWLAVQFDAHTARKIPGPN